MATLWSGMVAFERSDGRTVPAVTAGEMRAVDRVAVEEVGLELVQMMENAGRSLAAHAIDLGGPVVVLASGGGNGGGGLCAARHLHDHGVDVRVVLDRDPADLSGAAATQHAILESTPVSVVGPGDADPAVALDELVVDAVIGYGLTDAPRGPARELVAAAGEGRAVLALDVPSGVNATTGDRPGVAVDPDRTLTLALPKPGLGEVGGDLFLADLGIPPVVFERVGIDYRSPFATTDAFWIALDVLA